MVFIDLGFVAIIFVAVSSFKAFLHRSGFVLVFKVSTGSSSFRKSSLSSLGCCYLRRCVLRKAVVVVADYSEQLWFLCRCGLHIFRYVAGVFE